MSYSDDVARPLAGCRTNRLRQRAMRSGRFNGFDWHTWGMQMRRYPKRPRRPLWLWRARRSAISPGEAKGEQ